jgi:hypothetical protein
MNKDPEAEEIDQDNPIEEEVKTLMVEHDVDQDTAERAQELVDEGLDESDAVELAEGGL